MNGRANTRQKTTIALLNDSWEMIAQMDPTANFPPLTPPRAALHDLFSLAVCMGGLMLILFSDIRDQRLMDYQPAFESDVVWDEKRRVVTIGKWMLAAVAYANPFNI